MCEFEQQRELAELRRDDEADEAVSQFVEQLEREHLEDEQWYWDHWLEFHPEEVCWCGKWHEFEAHPTDGTAC